MENAIDPKCPGDDPTKKAVPQTFPCPGCGGEIEMWTDESKAKCSSCHKTYTREQLK